MGTSGLSKGAESWEGSGADSAGSRELGSKEWGKGRRRSQKKSGPAACVERCSRKGLRAEGGSRGGSGACAFSLCRRRRWELQSAFDSVGLLRNVHASRRSQSMLTRSGR